MAVLAVPVLVIAALGHRFGMLDSLSTYASLSLGFLLAALAVVSAVGAFWGIWTDDRRGMARALRGFVLGAALLVVPGAGAWKAVTYPRLTDISTDVIAPPPMPHAAAARGPFDAPVAMPGPEEVALQREAYPDIVSRHYPVSTARVFQAVKEIVLKRGWQQLHAREPSEEDETGSIEAVAITMIFAFRQDVAIRVVADGDGALVDMRSAARNAAHDLGEDAERIRRFFADLDTALQGISGV